MVQPGSPPLKSCRYALGGIIAYPPANEETSENEKHFSFIIVQGSWICFKDLKAIIVPKSLSIKSVPEKGATGTSQRSLKILFSMTTNFDMKLSV
jgi:hypothetical protein